MPTPRHRPRADGRRPGAYLAAACVTFALAPGLVAPLAVGRIGTALEVRSVVEGRLGAAPWRRLARLDPIENGLRVRLGRSDSLLRVGFYDGRRTTFDARERGIDGAFALYGPSEAELRQRAAAEGAEGVVHSLSVLFGRLLLALSPGRSAEVTTPDSALGVKGTLVRLLVDPEVGTFVAVDEGAVEVQALAGGDPVLVTAGEWVLVPPGGLATRPAPLGAEGELLEDPPLLDCCPGTEPPKPPRE